MGDVEEMTSRVSILMRPSGLILAANLSALPVYYSVDSGMTWSVCPCDVFDVRFISYVQPFASFGFMFHFSRQALRISNYGEAVRFLGHHPFLYLCDGLYFHPST